MGANARNFIWGHTISPVAWITYPVGFGVGGRVVGFGTGDGFGFGFGDGVGHAVPIPRVVVEEWVGK